MTSAFHFFRSATRMYMRSRSEAKSDASSPPAPARISRKALRLSSLVVGDHQHLDLRDQRFFFPVQGRQFLLHQVGHLLVVGGGQEPGRVAPALQEPGERVVFFLQGLEGEQFLGKLAEFFLLLGGFGQAQLSADLFKAGMDLFEIGKYLLTVPCSHTFS